MHIKIWELKDFVEEVKLTNSALFIDSSTFYDEPVKPLNILSDSFAFLCDLEIMRQTTVRVPGHAS